MNSVILIFLDGVGIGKIDTIKNPFFNGDFYFIDKLFGNSPSVEKPFWGSNGMFVFPTDANLNVDGLPQSGTGQTSILTGFNASKILGKHFGPFPHTKLLPVLKEKNIYSELKKLGFTTAFANAYPPKFFEYLSNGHKRIAATTKAAIFGGLKLNGIKELLTDSAVSHEIDNSLWQKKLGLEVEIISPEKAGENILKLSNKNNFVFYEYYFTDRWGHRRNLDFYNHGINILNKFLFFLIKNLSGDQTLIICSDHGNFEDLSVKTHTRNPAFTFIAGRKAEKIKNKIKAITDIKSAIIEILKV